LAVFNANAFRWESVFFMPSVFEPNSGVSAEKSEPLDKISRRAVLSMRLKAGRAERFSPLFPEQKK